MAKKKLTYTDDTGKGHEVNLDDEDTNGSIGGLSFFTPEVNSNTAIPTTIKMRYVNTYLRSNPKIRRRFYIGNRNARPAAINGGVVLGLPLPSSGIKGNTLLTWVISTYRGEVRQF